jgi:hypothetical protein
MRLFTHLPGYSFAAILLSVMLHQLSLQIYAYITGLDKPLGLHEVETATIYRQSAYEVGKFVSPTQQP